MSSYLITGTSRGLGLEFIRELVKQGSSTARLIIATTRQKEAPKALQNIIQDTPDRVKYVSLDVTSQESINEAVKNVTEILGSSGLDVLINNAGITKVEMGGALGMTGDTLLQILATNVVAVSNVTQAFLPLLRAGANKKLINISSTMGSIGITLKNAEFFKAIPVSAYNISKAALNSMTVQYAIQLKDEGFTVLAVSPGHLQTDLGGKDAPLTPADGARAVLKVIQDANVEDSGRFRNIFVEGDAVHDGQDPVW